MTVHTGFTKYLSEALANAALRNTTFTSPATVYVGLDSVARSYDNSAGTELVAGTSPGYARVAVTFAAPVTGADTSTLNPTAAYQSPTPSGNGLTAVGVTIWDALINGNPLYTGKLTTSIAWTNGVPIVIPAASLTVSQGGSQV